MRKMLIFCCLLFFEIASAQTVEVEKMHELSRRAKRGYLYHVNSDPRTGNLDLVFITSQNARRIKLYSKVSVFF